MKVNKLLKTLYGFLGKNKRTLLVSFIMFVFILTYLEYLTSIVFVAVFIVLGSLSKLYHKIIRSSVGVDLILFLALVTTLIYENIFLGLIVAWPSLLIADYLAGKLSHNSLVSLFGLTSVVLLSSVLPFSIILSLILLTIVYELITIIFYYLIGSPIHRIILFLITHIIFNLVLILSLAPILINIMK